MRKVDVSSVLGASAENPEGLESCIDVSGLNLYYAKDKRALNGIDLKIPKQRVTAFIGPSGCGKSSLLLSATFRRLRLTRA